MATYNSQITRSGAQALMPEDAANTIIGNLPQKSVVMSLARQLPNMSRAQRRLPVWSALPQAYFVNGDTGLKQTSNASWKNVFINAEELAVIVPIPENVLDDSEFDIWGQAQPFIEEAMGAAFDQAVLYGINAPSTWPVNIEQGCENTLHSVIKGQIGALWEDILSEGGIESLVEEDGFAVNGFVGALALRGRLRGLKDSQGRPIFMQSLQAGGGWLLDDQRIIFPTNGAIDPTRSLLFGGDWSQLVFAIRKDITYKILDQAVLTDGSGVVQFNLAQQDMIALRVVMRLGWALPNPINRINTNDATRYPFAVLEPTAPS